MFAGLHGTAALTKREAGAESIGTLTGTLGPLNELLAAVSLVATIDVRT